MCVTVIGVNLLGDGLREILDPRMRSGQGIVSSGLRTPPAVLDIGSLSVSYATRHGRLRALRDVGFSIADRRDAGAGRRVGLRQEHGLAGDHRLAGSGGNDPWRRHAVQRPGSAAARRPRERQALRGDRVSIVFQDPFTSLNPGLPIGLQVAEPLIFHRGHVAGGGARQGGRRAGRSGSAASARARSRLSASVERRHAAARAHRHRADLRSGARHPRRADHRARRDGGGADPRSARRAAPPARLVDAVHHAQPRTRQPHLRYRVRAVRGQRHRIRPDRTGAARARASLHARVC